MAWILCTPCIGLQVLLTYCDHPPDLAWLMLYSFAVLGVTIDQCSTVDWATRRLLCVFHASVDVNHEAATPISPKMSATYPCNEWIWDLVAVHLKGLACIWAWNPCCSSCSCCYRRQQTTTSIFISWISILESTWMWRYAAQVIFCCFFSCPWAKNPVLAFVIHFGAAFLAMYRAVSALS